MSKKKRSRLEPGIQAPTTVAPQDRRCPQKRRLDDLPLAEAVHVPTDEQGDRDGGGDRERPPRAARYEPTRLLGQDPALALPVELQLGVVRHGQVERLLEGHRLAGPRAELIVRAGRDRVDLGLGLDQFLEGGVRRVRQHGAGLHWHLLAPERLDNDDPQARQGDDDDVEDGDRGDQAGHPADLDASDLGDALPPAPDRGGQDHHVLHRAGQADADHEPDQTRQVAELDRQDRPDQRARSRDRREVVAEEDPAVRRLEVLAVVELVRGRHPRIVQGRDPRRQERAVIAVGHRQDRQDTHHHRHRVKDHGRLPPRKNRQTHKRTNAQTHSPKCANALAAQGVLSHTFPL